MQDASLAYRAVEWDHDARVVVRWMLVEALVWTVLVVVLGVAVEDRAGVVFVVDQDVVGAFAADGADEPFGVTVRPRCPRRDPDHLDACGAEDRVERGGELRVTVRTRNRNELARSSRSTIRLRACCVVQSPVGCAVTPRMCTRRVTTSITTRT
jgi:hypothetical protein